MIRFESGAAYFFSCVKRTYCEPSKLYGSANPPVCTKFDTMRARTPPKRPFSL